MDNGVIQELRGINGFLKAIVDNLKGNGPAKADRQKTEVSDTVLSGAKLSGVAEAKEPKSDPSVAATAKDLSTFSISVKDVGALSGKDLKNFESVLKKISKSLDSFYKSLEKHANGSKSVEEMVKAMSKISMLTAETNKLKAESAEKFSAKMDAIGKGIKTLTLCVGSIIILSMIVGSQKDTVMGGLAVVGGIFAGVATIAVVVGLLASKIKHAKKGMDAIGDFIKDIMLVTGGIILLGAVLSMTKGMELVVKGLGAFLGVVASIAVIALTVTGISTVLKFASGGLKEITMFAAGMLGVSLGLILLGAIIGKGGSGAKYLASGLAAFSAVLFSISGLTTLVMKMMSKVEAANASGLKSILLFAGGAMAISYAAIGLGALVFRHPLDTTVGLAAVGGVMLGLSYLARTVQKAAGSVNARTMKALGQFDLFAAGAGLVLVEVIGVSAIGRKAGWGNVTAAIMETGAVLLGITGMAKLLAKINTQTLKSGIRKLASIELLAAGAGAVLFVVAKATQEANKAGGWKQINKAMLHMGELIVGTGALTLAIGGLMAIPALPLVMAAGAATLAAIEVIILSVAGVTAVVARTAKSVAAAGGWKEINGRSGFLAGASELIRGTRNFLRELAATTSDGGIFGIIKGAGKDMVGAAAVVAMGTVLGDLSAMIRPVADTTMLVGSIPGGWTSVTDTIAGAKSVISAAKKALGEIDFDRGDMRRKNAAIKMLGKTFGEFSGILGSISRMGEDFASLSSKLKERFPDTSILKGVAANFAGSITAFLTTFRDGLQKEIPLSAQNGGMYKAKAWNITKRDAGKLGQISALLGQIMSPISSFANLVCKFTQANDGTLSIVEGTDEKGEPRLRKVYMSTAAKAIASALGTFLNTLYSKENQEKWHASIFGTAVTVRQVKRTAEKATAEMGILGSIIDPISKFAEMVSKYESSDGTKLVAYDENGKPKTVDIAKSSAAISAVVGNFVTTVSGMFTADFVKKLGTFEDNAGKLGTGVDALYSSIAKIADVNGSKADIGVKKLGTVKDVISSTSDTLKKFDDLLSGKDRKKRLDDLNALADAFDKVGRKAGTAKSNIQQFNDAYSDIPAPPSEGSPTPSVGGTHPASPKAGTGEMLQKPDGKNGQKGKGFTAEDLAAALSEALSGMSLYASNVRLVKDTQGNYTLNRLVLDVDIDNAPGK